MSTHITVVGASLGGLRAAEQLRAAGYRGSIMVIGEETHAPYNRPPLSKEVLAGTASNAAEVHATLAFRRRASIADVTFALGTRAEAADLRAGTVTLSTGTQTGFDGLVIATGLRSRMLPLSGPAGGRHTLRTLEDCLALRTALKPGAAVAVVGAGFIGCEIAATACTLGATVTVIDPFGPPMLRVLGPELATAVQRYQENHGVQFRIGDAVSGYVGAKSVSGVRLGSGETVAADVVIEAVGSVPNVDWLQGNGLDLSDGVLCENSLRVVGTDRAVAVGDIARFPNPLFDDVARRVEHWSMPTDTAKHAAQTLLDALGEAHAPRTQFTPVPAFWSDQFGLRLQSYGSPALADTSSVVEGQIDSPASLASGAIVTYSRADLHVGTVAINVPPSRHRKLRDAFTHLVPAA